jgi:hypothetical protein
MDSEKVKEAIRVARELARTSQTATDFHNDFFGIYGKFGELFPERAEREAFFETPEYQEIVRLRAALPKFRATISY